MNTDDALKVVADVVHIAKDVGPLVAAVPLSKIAIQILGPAADEFAERLRDRVRLYRYGRQLECVRKAEKMVHDAGFAPRAVPIKTLFPLLEGASLEENDDLHTMWAALLANAAGPRRDEIVRPDFVRILREMTPQDALVMNDAFARHWKGLQQVHFTNVDEIGMSLDALESWNLLARLNGRPRNHGSANDGRQLHKKGTYVIPARGFAFIAACRPPQSEDVEPLG